MNISLDQWVDNYLVTGVRIVQSILPALDLPMLWSMKLQNYSR